MRANQRKEHLLEGERFNKYIDEEEDFEKNIELANYNAIKDKSNYLRLEDEAACQPLHQKNSYANISREKVPQTQFTEQPVFPNQSFNNQPNKIVMNGITFVNKQSIRGTIKTQKKTKKPQMQVTCQRCYMEQMVPANSCAFSCYNCLSIEQCIPAFGIFICGSCQKQVQFIKCTRCGTINKVPAEAEYKKSQYNYKQQCMRKQDEISMDELPSEDITQKYFRKE